MILKVPKGENPYKVIGNYIRDNVKVIKDMIVTIEINGSRINELFGAYPTEEGYFIWESDWWEGEEDVALIDFFPVSEACNPKNAVPIEWIGDWLYDHSALQRTETEINIMLMIIDWQKEQEKQNESCYWRSRKHKRIY